MMMNRISSLIERRHRPRLATILGVVAAFAFTAHTAPAPEIRTVAGTGQQGYNGDGGPAGKALLNQPFGVVKGPGGALYVCDTGNHCIRKIDDKGVITTFAGIGEQSGYEGDGGPASEAKMFEPYEIRFSKSGDCFVVEMRNHIIRRINGKTGLISTLAGTGKVGFAGDGGPAINARFSSPHSIQLSPDDDTLYVCDIGNHRLRAIDLRSGIVSTIAGTGERKLPEDGGPFRDAPLMGPRAIDFDHAGQLWMALREGNRVYRLDFDKGTIHHVAGTGASGFTGHSGDAKLATLSGPKGISIGPDGRVYLADTESHSVRVIDPKTGLIQLLAGTGKAGDGPEGDPLRCAMDRLHGIFVDGTGNVFVGDTNTHRVRVITP